MFKKLRLQNMENLEELKNDTLTKIRATANLKELDEIRVAVLGKKGKLTEQMKGLGALPLEEKIAAGKALNVIKNEIDAAITEQKSVLEEKALNELSRYSSMSSASAESSIVRTY